MSNCVLIVLYRLIYSMILTKQYSFGPTLHKYTYIVLFLYALKFLKVPSLKEQEESYYLHKSCTVVPSKVSKRILLLA